MTNQEAKDLYSKAAASNSDNGLYYRCMAALGHNEKDASDLKKLKDFIDALA